MHKSLRCGALWILLINRVMTRIELDHYDISIGKASMALSEYLRQHRYPKLAVICDNNTRRHCLPRLIDALPEEFLIIEIPSGEAHKSIHTSSQIWNQLVLARFTRQDLLINLGGGVIGDMGGFAASCYMRGLDFIQIPTTLLSQVDASVGGKLAIDFEGYKNMIGLFQDPKAVLIDPDFLESLPYEELKSGYAEMIKHALIKDKTSWEEMVAASDKWQSYISLENIYTSVLIKKAVVQADPKEKGLRKILNFGHTIGHAIESYSHTIGVPLTHGHAIAIGMMAEAYLSKKLTSLSADNYRTIISYLVSIYGDVPRQYLENPTALIELMKGDKKNQHDRFNFSLLGGIGVCYIDIDVETGLLKESLADIPQRVGI